MKDKPVELRRKKKNVRTKRCRGKQVFARQQLNRKIAADWERRFAK